jgi:hypothetical protein
MPMDQTFRIPPEFALTEMERDNLRRLRGGVQFFARNRLAARARAAALSLLRRA